MARQTTFYNAKAVEVSTPTIKSASAIEKSYGEGTMERWKSQCPHCGQFHEIQWEDIHYEHEEHIVNKQKVFKVTKVWYSCPGCAAISDEATMKRQPARWEADNPAAYADGVRSFWLNAFVSQWASWESIILKYLKAIGNPRKMQVVYNTCFGLLWEDRGELEDEDSLLGRREDYGTREDGSPVELPDGVLVLTCGVDTQNDRLEYEVLGHGYYGETWGIRYGIIRGRPDDAETWRQLDDALNHIYRFADGLGLKISMTFVDEGGFFTQTVRQQCRARIGKKMFCIKGMYGTGKPYTAPPKQMKIVVNQRLIGMCWQYQLGVDSGKQMIMDNLKVKKPGAKYCHFPSRDDYGPAYFTGLLSERLEYDATKKNPWMWKKIPGHERNEALDCRNYALAAFNALPANLEEIDRRLKIARGEAIPQDNNAAPAEVRPAKRPRARKQGSGLSRFYDDW